MLNYLICMYLGFFFLGVEKEIWSLNFYPHKKYFKMLKTIFHYVLVTLSSDDMGWTNFQKLAKCSFICKLGFFFNEYLLKFYILYPTSTCTFTVRKQCSFS